MSGGGKSKGGEGPKSWWQWILVYPALALALITALPDWLERIEAWQVNIEKDKLAEAMSAADASLSTRTMSEL